MDKILLIVILIIIAFLAIYLNRYRWSSCDDIENLSNEIKMMIPRDARNKEEINKPFGMDNAKKLAKLLNIDQYVLTQQEFFCVMSKLDPKISIECIIDMTNTCIQIDTFKNLIINDKGTTLYDKISENELLQHHIVTPAYGSYGLASFYKKDEDGNLQKYISSDCYFDEDFSRPCKAYNYLAEGPLEKVYLDCGCLQKFVKSLPVVGAEVKDTSNCQSGVGCLAKKTNKLGKVKFYGVPITPAIWIANFVLLYCINPILGATMPGYIQYIPEELAQALETEGYVKYEDYKDLLVTCNYKEIIEDKNI